MHRRQFLILSLAGNAALLTGCAGGGAPPGSGSAGAATSGVLDVARAQGATSFLQAVGTAGLTERLSGSGPYTLFVPSNAAFSSAGMPRDQTAAQRIVAYHVVPGMVSSTFMSGLDMNHLTSTGSALNIDGRGDRIRIDRTATVTRSDLQARNGVVHLIDRVLAPAA